MQIDIILVIGTAGVDLSPLLALDLQIRKICHQTVDLPWLFHLRLGSFAAHALAKFYFVVKTNLPFYGPSTP